MATATKELPEALGYAPDSVYAECTTDEQEISDRIEREANLRHATMLAVRDERRHHTVRGCTDDGLRHLLKTYRRELEDVEDGDLPDSKTGHRARVLKAKIADIEGEQEWRAALAETWQAAGNGTHSITGYLARGGLAAVIDHGAPPPSYDLASRLDWRNWKEGRPHVLAWKEAA
ncbi:MAG TPA: hypothetical protein VMS11_07335 [Solirubrobacterales bacterium]|nr:hypothetical protein [Solirubrobacterales bacterium]